MAKNKYLNKPHICPRCKEREGTSHSYYCNPCFYEIQKERKARKKKGLPPRPPGIKAEYPDVASNIMATWRNMRQRAEAQQVPFTITPYELKEIKEQTDVCSVLGVSLMSSSEKGWLDYNATVDKVIPHEGYTKENVRVISQRANRIKTDASPQEILMVALWATDQVMQQRPESGLREVIISQMKQYIADHE